MSQELLLRGWIRAHQRANEMERVLAARAGAGTCDAAAAGQVLELRRLAADLLDEAALATLQPLAPPGIENRGGYIVCPERNTGGQQDPYG